MKEKLFDLFLYKDLQDDVRPKVLQEEWVGLHLEAGKLPLEHRINPSKYHIVDEEVVDTIHQKEVKSILRYDTELDKKESEGAKMFWGQMLRAPTGGLSIMISPPGGLSPYKEARINVGYKKDEKNIEFYGIPSKLPPSALLYLATRLQEFSDQNIYIESPDELREISIPLNIPETKDNPWDFMSQIFPLDSDSWEEIKNGKPWLRKEKLKEETKAITRRMSSDLKYARTQRDYIHIGAWGERQMERQGKSLDDRHCDGLTNTELLMQEGVAIDVFGNKREVSWEYHKGDCLKCGAKNVDVGPCEICRKCEKLFDSPSLNYAI